MIAYTIVSRAYVPHARVLARSYAHHHPGSKLWALLIDDRDHQFEEGSEPFHILHLEDLDIDLAEIHRMQMLFSGALIAVIKPWVFAHFLRQSPEPVLYIDGDFVIYDSLTPAIDEAGTGVILIPHVLHPIPRDGKDPNETTILGAGMFNAGMFGVGPDHGGFVEFLQERLRRECIFDPRVQRFNEQRWLDFVPPLFPHHVVRDPGMDVAYWNLHERPLEKRGDQWLVGGAPLRAFHFSSFDPRTDGVAGRFELDPSPRVTLSGTPGFGDLCAEYATELFANGFSDLNDTPFSFDTLGDGSPVYRTLRALFTDAVLAGDLGVQPYPPDPFDPAAADAFKGWYTERYAQTGHRMPRRLGQGAAGGGGATGWLERARSRLIATPTPTARPRASVDWIRRMLLDGAGERSPDGAFDVHHDRVGFICHGPRAALAPGLFKATLEWEPGPGPDTAGEGDLVLVVEAFVQGYVVGSRAATLADIREGVVEVPIAIPEAYAQEAVLFGLELRVLTRGGFSARLTAILLDTFDEVPARAPLRVDWLPVMAAGSAAVRRGADVVVRPGPPGLVVSGPNWRLVPGRYRVDLTMKGHAVPIAGVPPRHVGAFEVVAGERILAKTSLTEEDLTRGTRCLEFDVSPAEAGPNDQVGVQLRTETTGEFDVIAVFVHELGQAGTGAEPVG